MSANLHNQAGRLFLDALAVPEADRPALLDRGCGSDQRLRAEVESLLSHHRSETLIIAASATVRHRSAPSPEEEIWGGPRQRMWRAVRGGTPLLAASAAAAAVVFGLWQCLRAEAGSATRQRREVEFTGHVDLVAASVENWIAGRKARTEQLAADPRVRGNAVELVALVRSSRAPAEEIPTSQAHAGLVEAARPFLKIKGVQSVFAISSDGTLLAQISRDPAAPDGPPLPDRNAGQPMTAKAEVPLRRTFLGETIVVPPFGRGAFAKELEDVSVLMATAAPLRDDGGRIIGAVGFRLTTDEFNGLFGPGASGGAGACFAFDPSGTVLNDLPGAEELKRLGLIPASAAGTALHLRLRDPGAESAAGRNGVGGFGLAPTRPAADASQGRSGHSLEPYRNHAGVPVVGAWKWLDDHGFGIAAELPAAEAFAAVGHLDFALGSLTALLLIGPSLFVVGQGLRGALRRPRAAAVGNHLLTEKIGEGGVGVVYRARHSALDRTAAVKLLHRDRMTPYNVQAFQREVRAAAALTHPNTVAVFDCGDVDGRAYCVMEYVAGLTITELVACEGALPPGRVVHILRQAAAALEEAHAHGLVHRDIKPHNIMVCRRGLRDDVVKVLDFGLAKPIRDADDLRLTATAGIAGTPVYIAPERFRDPAASDPRSDLYSLGAVGFLMLTGRPLFVGGSATEAIFHTIGTEPDRPSAVLGRPIPGSLERVVMQCLSKNPDDRPASAGKLLELLAAVEPAGDWSPADARRWWDARGSDPEPPGAAD